jgi:hypothetical protein
VNAEPRHHWIRDWRNWAIIGLTVGVSAAATHEGHECRLRLDVASCAGGYGPFAAREGVRFTMGAVAAGMTIYAREHHFGKETWVPTIAYTTWATEIAVRQGTMTGPARTDRPARFRLIKP